jgi:hypothetical protein
MRRATRPKSAGPRAILFLFSAVLLALAGAYHAGSFADDKPADAALPPDLARVPADGLMVESINVSQLWNHATIQQLRQQAAKLVADVADPIEKKIGLPIADMSRVTFAMSPLNGGGGYHQLRFVTSVKPIDKARLLAKLVPDAKEETHGGVTVYTNANNQALAFLGDRSYVVDETRMLGSFLESTPAKDGGLAEALKLAAGKYTAVVGLNPTRLAQEAGNFVPSPFAALVPFFKAKSAVLLCDLEKDLRVTLRGSFDNEADAKAGEKAVQDGLTLLQQFLPMAIDEVAKEKDMAALAELLKQFQGSVQAAAPQRTATAVELSVQLKTDVPGATASLIAAVQKVREAAARSQSQNNLKQLALAMHNYNDTNNSCPAAAIYSKDGKPLLSWRVAILPYVEADDLCKQFHLDEAWDSAHNIKLLDKMPKIYLHPKDKEGPPYATRYLVLTGKDTPFQGTRGPTIPRSFPDGTSNTIMFVEADKAVPWSKPEDLPYDAKKPLPKFSTLFAGGFNVSVWDGSVRFVSDKISEKTMRAAITPAGGEVLGADW